MSGDPQTAASVWDAVKLGLGGIAGATLAAFAKNWLTGSGTDARELRQEYRDENKRLREENKDLRGEVETLTRRCLHYLTGRSEARVRLHSLERSQGLPVSTWNEDPKEGDT